MLDTMLARLADMRRSSLSADIERLIIRAIRMHGALFDPLILTAALFASEHQDADAFEGGVIKLTYEDGFWIKVESSDPEFLANAFRLGTTGWWGAKS